MSKKKLVSGEVNTPVKVGILHSLSGTMAISEPSLKDAELMAIAEINANGGILGRCIEPVIRDGASNPKVFANQARHLIKQEQVATIFGCWTSATRKAVLPVVEELNSLLWYPCQYEGLERSANIFYMGSCTNQQIEPAVDWLLANQRRRFYLVGSDYVFPRTANKIIKAQLKLRGGTCIAEDYIHLGEKDFRTIIALIKQTQPDVVFNTLNGDSNISFYQQYHEAGIDAAQIPIMAASFSEEELRRLGGGIATGHYSVWSYFQSLEMASNRIFVDNYKARYGADRVTSDPIEASYYQVYLWKSAVEKAQSFATDDVRRAAIGVSFPAPGGEVNIAQNHHVWKHFRIGQILPEGQFRVVCDFPDKIEPLPWLGMENAQSPVKSIVMDLLGEVSNGIQYNCQLEANSRSQEQLMAELVAYNQQLRQTQQRLVESESQYRQLQTREKLLKKRLSSQIRHALDVETVVKMAVEEIRNLLDIDRCQFLWYSESETQNSFEPSCFACSPALEASYCHTSAVNVMEVLGEKALQLYCLRLDDIANDEQIDECTRKFLQSMALSSLLVSPVHPRSGQSGVLLCEQYHQPRVWAEHEIELLESVVDQLAIAMERAKLYEESQAAAAAAQAKAEELEQALEDLQKTQAQLIQTEKMSTLGQLIAGIAHEINNPVNFITNNLDYVKDYTSGLLELLSLYQRYETQPHPQITTLAQDIELDFILTDLPKILASMEVGSTRIQHLVLSLRNFSRRDQNKMQRVDVHESIESTLIILNNRFKARGSFPGIEVVKTYGDLPAVECFPAEISQVFTNILSNAVDAIEELVNSGQWSDSKSTKVEGEPHQREHPLIKIDTEIAGENCIAIRITDNGPGIDGKTIAQLFDPFFTTKPIGKGTGLGLSISQEIIVDKHHGKLKCSSELGQGTEFLIELPIGQS